MHGKMDPFFCNVSPFATSPVCSRSEEFLVVKRTGYGDFALKFTPDLWHCSASYSFAVARNPTNLFIYLSFITLATAAVQIGYIPFVYKVSKYQTWYIAYTPLVYIAFHRPLITLHGGPGSSYNYTDPIPNSTHSGPSTSS